VEAIGLRAKLLYEAAELAEAYRPLQWTKEQWLRIGDALSDPSGDLEAIAIDALRGGILMVTTIVPENSLERTAAHLGGTNIDAAPALWLTDRVAPEATDAIGRAVRVEADVVSYAAAVRVADAALDQTRAWSFPGWEPVPFEVRTRITLADAVDREKQYEQAVAEAEKGWALVERLPDGAERTRFAAQLRSNRARACLHLDRFTEAAADYERARRDYDAIGDEMEAVRVASAELAARSGGDESIDVATLRHQVAALEAVAARQQGRFYGLEADLEQTRRWLLSTLAQEGTSDLQEVIGTIEVLRYDRPALRAKPTPRIRLLVTSVARSASSRPGCAGSPTRSSSSQSPASRAARCCRAPSTARPSSSSSAATAGSCVSPGPCECPSETTNA
jgi:hypothetical protein